MIQGIFPDKGMLGFRSYATPTFGHVEPPLSYEAVGMPNLTPQSVRKFLLLMGAHFGVKTLDAPREASLTFCPVRIVASKSKSLKKLFEGNRLW